MSIYCCDSEQRVVISTKIEVRSCADDAFMIAVIIATTSGLYFLKTRVNEIEKN